MGHIADLSHRGKAQLESDLIMTTVGRRDCDNEHLSDLSSGRLQEHQPNPADLDLNLIHAAMLEELGTSRKDTLHLHDVGNDVSLEIAEQLNILRPTHENAGAAAWRNVKFGDISPADEKIDNIADGQLARIRRNILIDNQNRLYGTGIGKSADRENTTRNCGKVNITCKDTRKNMNHGSRIGHTIGRLRTGPQLDVPPQIQATKPAPTRSLANKTPTRTPATKSPTITPATPATKPPTRIQGTKSPTRTSTTKSSTRTSTAKSSTRTPAIKYPTTPAIKYPTQTPATKYPTRIPATKSPTRTPTAKPLTRVQATKSPPTLRCNTIEPHLNKGPDLARYTKRKAQRDEAPQKSVWGALDENAFLAHFKMPVVKAIPLPETASLTGSMWASTGKSNLSDATKSSHALLTIDTDDFVRESCVKIQKSRTDAECSTQPAATESEKFEKDFGITESLNRSFQESYLPRYGHGLDELTHHEMFPSGGSTPLISFSEAVVGNEEPERLANVSRFTQDLIDINNEMIVESIYVNLSTNHRGTIWDQLSASLPGQNYPPSPTLTADELRKSIPYINAMKKLVGEFFSRAEFFVQSPNNITSGYILDKAMKVYEKAIDERDRLGLEPAGADDNFIPARISGHGSKD